MPPWSLQLSTICRATARKNQIERFSFPRILIRLAFQLVLDRFAAFLRLELAPSPARWRATARVVIACAIATTAVMTFRIPEGSWLIITILIVSQPDAGASITRALQRSAGTLLGGGFAIGLAITFPQQPWILLPCFALGLGYGIYLSRTSAAPYIPVLGSMTMILAIGGVNTAEPEGINIALWRFLNIGVGNLIGTLCQAFLWPEKPENLLRHHLAASLRNSGDRLGQCLLVPEEVVTDPDRLADSEERVMNSLGQWTTWLQNAEHDERRFRDHHDMIIELIGDINQIAIASQQVARVSSALALKGIAVDLRLVAREAIAAAKQRCSQYAEALENQEWTAALDQLPPLADRFTDLMALAETRSLTSSSDPHSLARSSVLSAASSLGEGLDSLPGAVDFLRPPERQTKHEPFGAKTLRPTDDDPIFVAEQRFNPQDAMAAAKATLAAMIAYIYINAIDWPGGITAVVTAILVSLDNYGAIIQKSVLRLAGAAVGGFMALLAILVVMPNIESLAGFLVVSSLIFGAGAWVQAGSGRVSYAGLQLAYAAALCLMLTHGPSTDLKPWLDRLLGVLLGIFCIAGVYAVFGEIRARVWSLNNVAETLRLMSQAARIGLRDRPPESEEVPIQKYRFEIYRRIAFSYRLLSESCYEDWFDADRAGAARETENLRRVIDRVRGLQRVLLSMLWNRLAYQRHSAPDLPGRQSVQDIGRSLPLLLESFSRRMENPGEKVPEAENALAAFHQNLEAARRALPDGESADSESRIAYNRLRAQLGFYEHLGAVLVNLEADAWALHVRQDNFSLAAWLRGPEKRTSAPSIRPA